MTETESGEDEPTSAAPGAPQRTAAAAVEAELQAVVDFNLFVGVNLEKFPFSADAAGAARGLSLRCWPGFFVPQAWFLYRKLYGWAALCCLIPMLGLVLHLGDFQRVFALAPSLIGAMGRRIYIVHAHRTISQIRALNLSEEEARDTIRRAGGVSTAGAVVGGLIVVGAFAVGVANGFKARLLASHPQVAP